MTDVSAVLKQRGTRYGSFASHSEIAQRLKAEMRKSPNWDILAPDMKEALEMVAHKIARILNGDPSYDDSWIDIAGYAQLVVNEIKGEASE